MLNYDELTQRGFITRRSFRKTMSVMARSIARAWQLVRRFKAVGNAWREAEPILTSRSFWNEYLGLK